MTNSNVTHAQAQLLLQLYDLRREEKLRKARDWFMANFWVESPEDVQKIAPPGSQENTYMRMVVSYWEQACLFYNQGLLDEEQFFITGGEFFMVWSRMQGIAAPMREQFKNPTFFQELEKAGQRYQEWSEKRAPGSIEAMRQFMQQARAATQNQ